MSHATARMADVFVDAESLGHGRIVSSYFRKDFRRMRLPWLAVVALAGVQMMIGPKFSLVLEMGVVILSALFILEDAPAQRGALWRTLPLDPARMLLAKLFTLGVLVVFPLVTLHAVALAREGIAPSTIGLVTAAAAAWLIVVVLATTSVAVWCRDLPHFAMVGVVVVTLGVLSTIGSFYALQALVGTATAARPTGLEFVALFLTMGAFAIAVFTGARRNRRRTALLPLVGGLFGLFVLTPMIAVTPTGEGTIDPAVKSFETIETALEPLDRGWIDDSWSGVVVGVWLHHDAGSVWAESANGVWVLDDGRRIPVSGSFDSGRNASSQVGLRDGRSVQVMQLFDLGGEDLARLIDERGRLELTIQYRGSVEGTAFSIPMARGRSDDGRAWIEDVRTGDSPSIRVATRGLRDGITDRDLRSGGRYEVVRENGEIHPLRGGVSRSGLSKEVGVLSRPRTRWFDENVEVFLGPDHEIREEWLQESTLRYVVNHFTPVLESTMVIDDFALRDWVVSDRN